MLRRPCSMRRLHHNSQHLRVLTAAATTAAALATITAINQRTSLTTYCQSTSSHCSSPLHTSSLNTSPTTWSSAPPTSTPRPAAVHANVNSTLLQLLSRQCRGLPAKGADIEIINTPTDFYNTLLTLIDSATQHITLSSLYLGTGPLEQKLVAAIQARCQQIPSLRVHILLDYYRATRPTTTTSTTTATITTTSSLTTLAPLLSLNTPTDSQRVTISLFKPPVRLAAGPVDFLFRGRWRELRGVHHMKYYMIDNNTILSGANLSDTYFENRQDRYLLFKNNTTLVDWLQQLTTILTTSQFSYHTTTTPSQLTQPANGSDAQQLQQRLMALVKPSDEDGVVGMNAAHATLMPQVDTWLFPALQLGMIGVREEENIITRIIKLTALTAFSPHNPLLQARKQPPTTSSSSAATSTSAASASPPPPLTAATVPCLSIATGYMNLPSIYTNALLSAATPVELLASSESANGWYGAKGVAVHVPRLYSAVLYEFLMSMAAGSQRMVSVAEWQREGWSYHVKGMWLSMGRTVAAAATGSSGGEAAVGSQSADVVLSVIGSTNFGLRSLERDAECSVVIVTKGGLSDGSLARRLGEERDRLWSNGVPVTVDTFEREGSERRLPWLIRSVAKFARQYL